MLDLTFESYSIKKKLGYIEYMVKVFKFARWFDFDWIWRDMREFSLFLPYY